MLQLRVINGLFVAAALLFALAVAGSIFPMRHLAPWFSAPVLLIPCIAHYSTVVSNYPFLIGGYVIQMVVLSILWVSLDSPALSNLNLAKIGALLGLGIGIALCSADNAMVTLPFWGIIIPAYITVRIFSNHPQEIAFKEAVALLFPMIGVLLILCSIIAVFSINRSFLPQITSNKLAQILPVHGSLFLAGIALITFYAVGVWAVTIMFYNIGCLMANMNGLRIPWRPLGRLALLFATAALILYKVPVVPEIDLLRGGNTTPIKYAVMVVAAFADGFLPGQCDGMIAESFWRHLGWLETELPKAQMDILRIGCGLGVFLLFFIPLRKANARGMALFAVANMIGLMLCVLVIGVMYGVAHYNVNSRYILIAYLLAASLAAEGYRRLLDEKEVASESKEPLLGVYLPIVIGIQSWTWITILNRYF